MLPGEILKRFNGVPLWLGTFAVESGLVLTAKQFETIYLHQFWD
jgi:hypothetical protein